MKVNVCSIYWTLLFVSFVSSCLLFLLVATESGVINSSIKTLGINDTVDSETSAKNSEGLENYGEQQEQTVVLNENGKGQSQDFGQTPQKLESVAEIHSSFEEVVSASNVEIPQSGDASYIIPPKPVSDVTAELFETGQAMVFTLVDTSSAELQDQASSPSHQHTEGLLNDNVSTVTSDETQRVRLPLPDEDESLPTSEETSKNLSISEDAVDYRSFQEKDQQYVVHAEPKIIEMKSEVHAEDLEVMLEGTDPASVPEAAPVTNASVKDSEAGKGGDLKLDSTEVSEQGTSSEDIPLFSEWAQKQLAEAEKKKFQNSTTPPTGSPSRASGTLKVRSKNYASPDCGAKIVGTNPEAMYAGSIISPSRDEYVLNACSNRFWFVVELCEAIQAKKIDLANFELFSSSPRDFSVSLSDRFPSRDWQSVGHFTAQDERDVQSFDLNPHLFGKFIKVELHSHYGSEHYCPISLFRVYGTSEFEVFETESVPNMADDDDDDGDDNGGGGGGGGGDDDEEPLDVDTGEPPKTLFGSAQDAVMSIVKKATQALVKGGDVQNDTTPDAEVDKSHSGVLDSKNCVSPSHIIVCDNCSDAMFSEVFELLSCQSAHLQALISSPFVRSSFQCSKLCLDYGLDFSSHRAGAPYPLQLSASGVDPLRSDQSSYLSALLPPAYIAALCNILAVLEKKVVLNISYEVNGTMPINLTSSLDGTSPNVESDFGSLVMTHPSTCTLESSITSQHCSSSSMSDSGDTTGFATSSLLLDSLAAETAVASQIKPTKTIVKEPVEKEDFPSVTTVKTNCDQEKETVVLAELSSVQEPPAGVSPFVTASVYPGQENQTGAQEALKESAEVEAKTPVYDSGFVDMEMTDDFPTLSETDQKQQQSEGNEKKTEVTFQKYQESQDSLSFDSFLSELKALDTNSSSAAVPVTVTTTTVSPPSLGHTQQVQKESVFVRLFNRVKALERNMSLSGQYLEELSRRYKKQVEEMQRAVNRTLAAVAEESRKGEEREQKHIERTAALQKQLATLTVTLEVLLSERESWQHKAAVIVHVVLIVIEVVVLGAVLYFCRHMPDAEKEHTRHRWSSAWHVQKEKDRKVAQCRRKSVQGISGHEAPKVSNRRPSEEALNISGTYSDLLIESHTVEIDDVTGTVPKTENKRRRRKRKDTLQKSSSSANLSSRTGGRRVSEYLPCLVDSGRCQGRSVHTRRASSSELGKWWNFTNGVASKEDGGLVLEQSLPVMKHSGDHPFNPGQEVQPVMINGSSHASSASGRESPLGKEKFDLLQGADLKERVSIRTKEKLRENAPMLHEGNWTMKSAGINSKGHRLPSPSFMKTAMSARSNRIGNSIEPSPQARLKSDNWEWYSSRRAAGMTSNKSSQGTLSPVLSLTTLHNGSGRSASGHPELDDLDQTSETGGGSRCGVSEGNGVKMSGSTGLKKMVK